MSNFSDVRELLQHNKLFHDRTADFYTQLARQVISERVKMFLSTLVKHEVELSRELASYIEQAPDSVLNTFFQFDHTRDESNLYQTPFTPSECTAEDVEALATRIDDYLCDLYVEMMEEVDSPRVKEVFENLYQHMLEEKKRLSTDIYSLWDM